MNDEQKQPAAWIGALVVVAIVASIALYGISGFRPLFDFLTDDSAPAWVQAVGSIAAILAAYHLGRDAHKRQVRQQNQQEAQLRMDRALMLKELFEFAKTMDRVADETSKEKVLMWIELVALADDFLIQARSLSVFDLPNYELVHHLNLARQSAIAYKDWGSLAGRRNVDLTAIRFHLAKFAAEGVTQKTEAISLCEHIAAKAKGEVERLS